MVYPSSTLSSIKSFILEGMGSPNMEDVREGPGFLEKLDKAGITFKTFKL